MHRTELLARRAGIQLLFERGSERVGTRRGRSRNGRWVSRDVVALRPSGHNVILGTAGSGKTTMAMLRALALDDPRTEHAGRTLLVIFNKSLLAFLRHVIPASAVGLDVRNYHRFARGYLRARGKDGPPGHPRWSTGRIAGEALREVRAARGEAVLSRDAGFFGVELAWMAGYGIAEEASYLEADRVGRGEALGRQARKAVLAAQRSAWSPASGPPTVASHDLRAPMRVRSRRLLGTMSTGQADVRALALHAKHPE